jgi:integrase/recombinase XerC
MTVDQLTSVTPNAVITRWKAEGYAQGTIASRRKRIGYILTWLITCGASPEARAALTRVRTPKARAVIATPEEVDRLFANACPWMRCWLVIAAQHGLRWSEVKRLSRAHYNEEQGTITFRTKGESTNQLPASDELREFMRTAPPSDDPNTPLIELLHGKPMSTSYIRKAWYALKRKAGVNMDLWPHDLRRTLAVRTYELTHDLRDVQQVLGHAHLSTTCLYLQHQDPERIREFLHKLEPRYIRTRMEKDYIAPRNRPGFQPKYAVTPNPEPQPN